MIIKTIVIFSVIVVVVSSRPSKQLLSDRVKRSSDDDNTKSPLPVIFGIIGSLIGIVIFIVFVVVCIKKHKNKKQAAKIENGEDIHLNIDEDNGSDTPSKNKSLKEEFSGGHDNVERSISILPKSGMKALNVIHCDLTDVIVPAELKRDELKQLLRSLRKNNKIIAIEKGDQKAEISRVMTYATDDEITLCERSDRENSDDLLSSVKYKSEVELLMLKMIANGPREYPFEYDELMKLLNKAANSFAKEPSLLEVPVPCLCYGDIHGQYSDLHRWFNLNGWPHQTRSVFLGDFVDRGSHGVEVIALISCLKIVFPDKIFIVRGNHEEESLNRAYSFFEEVVCRFPGDGKKSNRDGITMYNAFKNLFMHLPLAVLIGGRVLAMHGGVSPKMESLQAIRNIKRPIDDFEVGSLECDLVWSDPDTGADTGFRPNLDREPNNGIGQLFAADTVKKACERLHVDMIIRGHQAPLHGYALFAEGKMLTLFSAPGYKGSTSSDVNMGACMEFDNDMKITIKQIKVTERFRQNRINDTERQRIARKERRFNKN